MLFAHKTVGNEKLWSKPKRQPSNRTYPQAQKDATRRLANTLLIDTEIAAGIPDKPLGNAEARVITMKSKRVCFGGCEREDEMDTDEAPSFCSKCKHLRILYDGDESKCKTCGRNVKSGETLHPCTGCTIEWLLKNNGIQSRLEKEEEQRDDVSEPTVKRARVETEEDDDKENATPPTRNYASVSTTRDLRFEPVGRQVSDVQVQRKMRRKVGLPLSANPEDVNARLSKKRTADESSDELQDLRIKRRQSYQTTGILKSLKDTETSKRKKHTLAKKVRFKDEMDEKAEIDRMIAAAVRSKSTSETREGEEADSQATSDVTQVNDIVPQGAPAPMAIIERDLHTTTGTELLNDNIMNKVLRLIGQEDGNVHVCTTGFAQSMRDFGWTAGGKRYFRDPDREKSGTLTVREKRKPSLNAPVLLMEMHTGSGKNEIGHWNPLIRDARGVGMERAVWRYFDTLFRERTLDEVKAIIKDTPLWQDGMTWECVDTPQQASKKNDCGALTSVIACSYVRWSRNVNHVRLNSNRLQLKNREEMLKMGRTARVWVHDAASQDCLPESNRDVATRSFRFKSIKTKLDAR